MRVIVIKTLKVKGMRRYKKDTALNNIRLTDGEKQLKGR
jgi:uncharacterized Zn ribbon protein